MVVHLVWDQGVAGSNPVFPTIVGALAQLGERLLCTQEVRSSILLGSTNLINHIHGGIAQLARAFGSYPECRGFKSLSRYHLIKSTLIDEDP